jgi:hypothetical protein
MGAVTYPDKDVEAEIREDFVPVQYNIVDHPERMEQFHAHWTPTIIIQDAAGEEVRRSEGYLDAKRLLGELALARVKAAVESAHFKEAKRLAPDAVKTTEGDPTRAPEALYWSAVASYKASEDPNNLVAGWNKLLDTYPDSEWAKKASFIRD